MKLTKTYRYKLRLSTAQAQRVERWTGTCRFLYNLGLECRIAAYQKTGKSVSAYQLMKELPLLKKEHNWIGDVPSQTLQNVFERLDVAYSKFFAGGGFPKWTKKGKYNSLLYKSVKFNNGVFELPKIGVVKVFKDRRPEGKLKTATIIKEGNSYFLSVSVETESAPQYCNENQVGIDVGIVHFCSDSNGKQVANPRHFLGYERKLRIENRALARKKKGSYGWRKQKASLNKLHAKIARVRKDFLHQQSSCYVRSNHLIVVEKLKVSNMVRFGSLSKHIADTGWGTFKTMLSYKCALQEKEFVAVKPHYTSQTCSCCGHVAKENRTSQSVFVCTRCSHAANADVNAAKNILGLGKAFVRQREAVACA